MPMLLEEKRTPKRHTLQVHQLHPVVLITSKIQLSQKLGIIRSCFSQNYLAVHLVFKSVYLALKDEALVTKFQTCSLC